jgi:hypothetical protein
MSAFDWKGLVKNIAPMLGTALAGPLGGIAGAALGKALGTPDAEDATLSAAIQGASPEQLLLIQKADQEFKLQMSELGFKSVTDLEKIAADDRASARDREKIIRDKMPMILGIGITIGFFALVFYMMKFDIPAANKDVLNIMLGSLATAWIGVTTYYFGSSAGSARKTEIEAAKK